MTNHAEFFETELPEGDDRILEIARALYIELRCYHVGLDYQEAEVDSVVTQQEVMATNPSARQNLERRHDLQQQINDLHRKGVDHDDPRIMDLRRKLKRLRDKYQKIEGRTMRCNSQIQTTTRIRDAARLRYHEVETELYRARTEALVSLDDLEEDSKWSTVEQLLGPELRHDIILSGLRLAGTQKEYQRTMVAAHRAIFGQPVTADESTPKILPSRGWNKRRKR